ncbi:hypothetical protein BDF20DRAFT_870451 [Mycotypha africana]|uniref:uncharacterized protein n=1 Tax=Mycotypha africana TaxID=64632 RepID=UPI0022FFE714|nr:uncharacterized protein BDF20DRAFT_870451 [Mycotypha africana]KAI8979580.1 hypothetical protein BDF20DRAFT_870451 [Mycotypha africana]
MWKENCRNREKEEALSTERCEAHVQEVNILKERCQTLELELITLKERSQADEQTIRKLEEQCKDYEKEMKSAIKRCSACHMTDSISNDSESLNHDPVEEKSNCNTKRTEIMNLEEECRKKDAEISALKNVQIEQASQEPSTYHNLEVKELKKQCTAYENEIIELKQCCLDFQKCFSLVNNRINSVLNKPRSPVTAMSLQEQREQQIPFEQLSQQLTQQPTVKTLQEANQARQQVEKQPVQPVKQRIPQPTQSAQSTKSQLIHLSTEVSGLSDTQKAALQLSQQCQQEQLRISQDKPLKKPTKKPTKLQRFVNARNPSKLIKYQPSFNYQAPVVSTEETSSSASSVVMPTIGTKRQSTGSIENQGDNGNSTSVQLTDASDTTSSISAETLNKKQKVSLSWPDIVNNYLKNGTLPNNDELKEAFETFYTDVSALYKKAKSSAILSNKAFDIAKTTNVGDLTITLPTVLANSEKTAIVAVALMSKADVNAVEGFKRKLATELRDLAVAQKNAAQTNLLFRYYRLYIACCKVTNDVNSLLHVMIEILRSPTDKKVSGSLVNIAYIWYDAFQGYADDFLYVTFQHCICCTIAKADEPIYKKMAKKFDWVEQPNLKQQEDTAVDFLKSDIPNERKVIYVMSLFLCLSIKKWSSLYNEYLLPLLQHMHVPYIKEAIATLGSHGVSLSVFIDDLPGVDFLEDLFEADEAEELKDILRGRTFLRI